MSWRDVPAILRRCVVAVYGKSTGGGPDGVVRAFKICRDKLAKDGYLYPRGSDQVLESIQLTGKGFNRNLHHVQGGPTGDAKDLSFSRLFEMLEPRLYELDGRGGKQAPSGQPSASGSAVDAEAAKIIDKPTTLSGILGDGKMPPDERPKR